MVKVVPLLVVLTLIGCGPLRPPVPVGTIPSPTPVSAEDEEYGHRVLGELTRTAPLSRDDAAIRRVREIAQRITATIPGAEREPWHVFVLEDVNMVNAGATRGNYLFVWTGMLQTVRNDDELAMVIAHELGHLLAEHVVETPQEAARRILSGVAGNITGEVVARQGPWGAAAGLAGLIVRSALEATLVNPEQQRKELEADHIGLFLMARAGFDPSRGIGFWERALADATIGGPNLGLLSTHPPTEERLEALRELLPRVALVSPPLTRYRVVASDAVISTLPARGASIRREVPRGTIIMGTPFGDGWIRVEEGFVRERDLSSAFPTPERLKIQPEQ